MEANRYVSWTPPSVATVISFAVMLISIFAVATNSASRSERQDARLDTIEDARASTLARYETERQAAAIAMQRQLDPLYKMHSEFPVVVQRLTTVETTVAANFNALDARVSRIAEALGPLREGITEVNTNVKLLAQRFDTQFPNRRAGGGRVNPMAFIPHRETDADYVLRR